MIALQPSLTERVKKIPSHPTVEYYLNAMSSADLNSILQKALQHLKANQLTEAETLCRHVLAENSDHADALHLLAIINAKLGRPELAIPLFRQAVALKPSSAEAHYDCANALQNAGQLEESIAMYQRAVSLNSNMPAAHNNLGVAFRELGRPNQAVAAFRYVIALNPSDARAHINLGNALKDQRQFSESISALRKAIELKPSSAEAHNNLSVCLRDAGQWEQSLVACQRAIALQPGLVDAHNNLGVLLTDMGKLDEAMEAYRKAISLNPAYAQAHYNLGNGFKAQGRLDEAIASYQQAITLKPTFVEADNNLVYTLHFHPAYDAHAIAEEHRRWNRVHAEPLKKFIQPHSNDRDAKRRLRIGYVSPDLREHPVGRFLLPLLARHNKKHFETFAYTDVISPDQLTATLRTHVDHWQTTVGLSDSQIAELIRHDQIDILVDLTMHMAHNRLLVFARKPAPVQLTWLAYCSTTGLDAIDYRLSDPHLDPSSEDESVYSEKTVRLPETYWCYQPVMNADEVSSLPAATNRNITFGCLNNFAKVSEPALIAWAEILRAVPKSQLLLRSADANSQKRIANRMQREAVESDRIQFVDRLSMLDYLRVYHRIDIALDTFPYAGGTITCDALWMGVPVVTLLGQTAVGRGGASILSNVGLPELVARTREEYVQRAIQLAGDVPRLQQLRSTVRQQMKQSPLMNEPRFAENVESAYQQMWRQWCATTR